MASAEVSGLMCSPIWQNKRICPKLGASIISILSNVKAWYLVIIKIVYCCTQNKSEKVYWTLLSLNSGEKLNSLLNILMSLT